MFIRTRKRENGKVTILIVENERIRGKVHQKTMRSVATVFPEEVERFMELAEHIKAEMELERTPQLFPVQTLADTVIERSRNMVIASRHRSLNDDSPLPVNLRKLREASRIVTGIHEIYGSLYDELGFSRIFTSCPISRSIVKDVVMVRLSKPCSKRSTAGLLEMDFGINIPLEKIYRMLDTLTEKRISRLQDICWQYSQGLFTEEIKVMFYDCTTLYFESFTEDELRRFGYSNASTRLSNQDHKFNQSQVLLALMVTKEGLPVGYDVFPGNMYEGDTFKSAMVIEPVEILKRSRFVTGSGG
jgi:hypothetical protein